MKTVLQYADNLQSNALNVSSRASVRHSHGWFKEKKIFVYTGRFVLYCSDPHRCLAENLCMFLSDSLMSVFQCKCTKNADSDMKCKKMHGFFLTQYVALVAELF